MRAPRLALRPGRSRARTRCWGAVPRAAPRSAASPRTAGRNLRSASGRGARRATSRT
jgi:hypothetical protein